MARCDFPRQQAQHWGEVTGGGECGPGLRGHDCQPLLLCPPELGAGDTGTEAWLFFFFLVLRYNSHNIKFIMLKCTIQWISVHLLCCATLTAT